jgi:hypothetical protein
MQWHLKNEARFLDRRIDRQRAAVRPRDFRRDVQSQSQTLLAMTHFSSKEGLKKPLHRLFGNGLASVGDRYFK